MTSTPSLRLLVTGGAGYIGSHTVVALAEAGHRPVVLDNLENGHAEAVERAGRLGGLKVPLVCGDITDPGDLDRAWEHGPYDAVLHFAALKSVEESVRNPERYAHINVEGTHFLCQAMERQGCRRLVFSSSASVYGDGDGGQCSEGGTLLPLSPYGESKIGAEKIIDQLAVSHGLTAVSLRYFNPVGAHPSGELGEAPKNPANLAPILLEVAAGHRAELEIFGTDYETEDGTCIRDYIDIIDLAGAHLAALEATASAPGHRIYNVGTGRGVSVLEMVDVARRITGQAIASRVGPRRSGDIATLVADVSRIREELGWTAKRSLDDMIATAWTWCRRYPLGYSQPESAS